MSKIQEALEKHRVQRNDAQGDEPQDPGQAVGREMAPIKSADMLAKMPESRLVAPEMLESHRLVDARLTAHEVLDSYRSLRSTLLRKVDKHANVVCVTSVWPPGHDGLLAANLATVIAGDESRSALLIDCNLARPSVARLFELKNARGLTDYLARDDLDVASLIQRVGVRRLRAIPVGRGDAEGDCFLFRKMKELIAELRSRYDDRMIILNAPPLRSCADAVILAEQSDHVLLAVPYGRVTMAQISDAVRVVGPAKVAGVVFSDVPWVPAFGVAAVITDALRQLRRPAQWLKFAFGASKRP